jgi:hypothetical protein
MLGIIKELEEVNGYTGKVERSQRERTHSSIILTGNPGIGKTWFQSAILVDRLLAGFPTVLQTNEGLEGERFLLFDQRGVSSLHELARNDPVYRNVRVWALADQQARGLLHDFQAQEWLTIVTSSPRDENYKQVRKASAALVYYMPVWNWPEIVAASRSQDIAELRALWDQFHKYGPVARLLLDDLYSTNREQRDARIKSYDSILEAHIYEYIYNQGDDILFGRYESHALLLLEPKDPTPLVYNSTTCSRRVITPTIAMRLAECAFWYSERKALRLYKLLLDHPSTSTAAGWVLEIRAHIAFSKGGIFVPRLISTQPTATLELRLKSCPANMMGTFDSRQLEDTFREKEGSPRFNRELEGVYMRAQLPNLPAMSSLVVIMKGGHPRAILFQMTIAENHPINGPGLSEVWKALPDEVRKVDPAIVFVVPWDKVAGYKTQNIEGTPGDSAEWPQFVLDLDDKVLWPSCWKFC